MAWDNESMIKAIEGALEREKAEENNSGIIGMSFQIAEKVLIPLLRVKVIKCKDCIHQDGKDGQCPVQNTGDPFYDSKPDDDWFCADGRRKEEVQE